VSTAAVTVEGLSKRYRLGAREAGFQTLRESIAGAFGALARLGRTRKATEEHVWALQDVSFEIAAGRAVGIIGRNGAGKTTLLRILARITEPTGGRAVVRGRVASLLEVGTGFHPELTGRENVFLNAAILGMTRAEIRRKFDEIVAFAEVAKFIDTPTKRYSSGMQTRLAFSVAAHLEPDILIVDEVLAVGDTAFQAKCLGKMESVAREGRTVLFVSHNMAAVQNLCDSAVVLHRGQVVFRGGAREGVQAYVKSMAEPVNNGDLTGLARHGLGGMRFTALRLRRAGEVVSRHVCGDPLDLGMKYALAPDFEGSEFNVQVRFQDENGAILFSLWNKMVERGRASYPREGWLVFHVNRLPLRPGIYHLTFLVKSHRGTEDWLDQTLDFEVVDGDFFGTGRMPVKAAGPILVDHSFKVCDEF
jgi:lipopolysaccharide transport system ATP-binding protein